MNAQSNNRLLHCYCHLRMDGMVVMTDTGKYKSVAVKKPSYQKLKKMAEQDYRSVASFIEYLVDKEAEERRNSHANQ